MSPRHRTDVAGEWQCARCCYYNIGVVCTHCAEPAHGAGDDACTWETLPGDHGDAGPVLLLQVCPHGLSRFATV